MHSLPRNRFLDDHHFVQLHSVYAKLVFAYILQYVDSRQISSNVCKFMYGLRPSSMMGIGDGMQKV